MLSGDVEQGSSLDARASAGAFIASAEGSSGSDEHEGMIDGGARRNRHRQRFEDGEEDEEVEVAEVVER